MIPKNQFTQGILTGAVVASAVVILSVFEPDRFVLPAILATVILVFCAPYLTFGRAEGLREGRAYQLAAVVAGIAGGLVILGQLTGGFIPPGCCCGAAGRVNAGNRPYGLGAVEGWRTFDADITGRVRWQGGLGDVGCGRLFLVQRHLVRSGVECGASDGASALPGP